MKSSLISIVLPIVEACDGSTAAVQSVYDQTHRPLELIIVAGGVALPAELKNLLAAAPSDISVHVVESRDPGAAACLNAGVRVSTGDYVAPITSRERYAPQRIVRCLAVAKPDTVVVTYFTPISGDAKPLAISHPWRVDYDRRLLHHIAVFPNVSCLAVWMDIVVTPGNLFFPRSLWLSAGGFDENAESYHLAFFLRAALDREPVVLREKLLSHKPAPGLPTAANADVIRQHLLRLWSPPRPANALADVFTAHPFLSGHAPWTAALSEAFDGLLEYRKPPATVESRGATREKAPRPDNGREFTIVTHELSLTGAPVIVLEMASLLQARGERVRVLSLKDGPLKDEFLRRGLRIYTPPVLLDRISRLHERLLRWSLRGKRLPERALHVIGSALHEICERGWQLQVLLHTRGILLINSVASWPLAARLLERGRRPAYWYIHESLDPQWLMPGERDNAKLKRLVERDRLRILFGSEATRRHWAGNGYDGCVRYWSGISGNTEYLGPASLRSGGTAPAGRRTILNVGTVSGRKGTRALLEAFALGRRDGLIPPDVQLCIVGCPQPSKNAEARDLICRAYQADLRGHVRIVHSVEPAALASFYREADVYAHGSIFDCMPLAVLTAMAHGLPVVTTDVDGCIEAIEDERSGLLVQPGDLRQMAAAIGRLLTQPDFSKRLGESARARFIERFSSEATFPRLHAILIGTADW